MGSFFLLKQKKVPPIYVKIISRDRPTAAPAAFPGARISATDGLSAAGKVMAERLKVEIKARPPESWDGTVVVVDTSNPEHCAPLPACDSVVVIDHHQTAGEWPAGTLLVHEPGAKSTAEIVTRLLAQLGVELTPEMALPLLAGVYADTGHFRHPETRQAMPLARHDRRLRAAEVALEGGSQLTAMLCGAAWDSERDGYGVEVKAVSYHELLVEPGPPV